MVIDADGTIPPEIVAAVADLPHIIAVRRLNPVMD